MYHFVFTFVTNFTKHQTLMCKALYISIRIMKDHGCLLCTDLYTLLRLVRGIRMMTHMYKDDSFLFLI